MTEQDRFQEAIIMLLRDEPFFAHFIAQSRIVWTQTAVPTAGVSIENAIPHFYLNSKFTATLSQEEFVAVLKHEVLHFVMLHILKKPKNNVDQKLWNVAMDCTINQYISDLPKGAVTLKEVEEACEKTLKPFQTSKYYYEALKNSNKLKSNMLKTLDEHNFCDVVVDEIAQAMIDAKTRSAMNKSTGNMSLELSKMLSETLGAKINWKSVFRNFVLKLINNTTRNTRKKLNRRFGADAPGKIKERKLLLGVCLDSSGSVQDTEFAQFLSEVRTMAGQGVEIFLVDADCKVLNTKVVKKKSDIQLKRSGFGGTAYQPAIDACMKRQVDAIVYFGDMDSGDVPINPRIPFLWVVCGTQNPPANFGKVIRL